MDEKAKAFWESFETETGSFRFKYVPETIRPLMSSRAPEDADTVEFNVERRDIVSVRVPKRGFFARLFRSTFAHCSFVARGPHGEMTYVFSADPSSGLLAALEKAWPSGVGTVVH